jgi:NAD(P)-dependent dehydrogenase (short-subunit alcohol dehydrogenase family)
MNLQGKVALITGGAVRVGRAITLELASLGAHVVINYHHSAEAATATAAAARALGVDALPMQCDVADFAAVDAMAAAIIRRFGGVDVIVNAASFFGKTPFPSSDPAVRDTWQTVTRILVDGPYAVCNALAPAMLARARERQESGAESDRASSGGAIVNIVDLAAFEPWRNFAAHGVGKAALLALTRQMALELAPAIRVNAIAPGNVLPPEGLSQEQLDRLARRSLLKRWGAPADVAHAVRFLLEADFITGEVLVVDGGELMARAATSA